MKRILSYLLVLTLVFSQVLPTYAVSVTPGRLQESKERADEVKQGVQQQVSEVQQRAEEIRENAQDRVAQARGQVQNRIVNHLDRVISHLEKIKTRLQAATEIDTEHVNAAVVEIDSLISELESEKSTLAQADSDEAIRSAGQTISHAWQRVTNQRRHYIGLLVSAKSAKFVGRVDQTIYRMENHLNELNNQGYDVSAGQTKLSEARSQLSSIQTNTDAAVATFRTINAQNQSIEVYQQGLALIRDNKTELKVVVQLIGEAIEVTKEVVDNSAQSP